MRITQTTRIGAWLLIGLNLLMAFGCIWIFVRMAPAIAVIINQNERSVEACEEMLTTLAMIDVNPETNAALRLSFANALKRTEANITESHEVAAIKSIKASFSEAFAGNVIRRQITVASILELSKINREAMVRADIRAQQLGYAGAWGVVFMAATVFFATMLFKRSLSRNLIFPLEEIHAVISANLKGDAIRRCSGVNLSSDVKIVFDSVNDFLDKH